jgi:para-nitrobenzyl esterase
MIHWSPLHDHQLGELQMAGAEDADRPQPGVIDVSAPCGEVRGRIGPGIAAFRGIRYAAAPTGQLRFAPPQPAPRAATRIDATQFGLVSLQDIDPLPKAIPAAEHNFYAAGAQAGEDCLNLNVWTPDTSGRAPVLVWIHGGAFLYGSGTGAWIDGTAHAREHGLVVVTLNYRLGLLGGLYLGDAEPGHCDFAIQDQIMALRWVQENIAAFGGDPARVTVGGQSAGAMSAVALLAAPAARGLFARAIVESGHADATVSVETARAATAKALKSLHIEPGAPDVLARLRALSVFRIADTQRELGIEARIFPLVGDGYVLPADPFAAIAAGSAKDVDLMIGTTREEHRLFEITGWAGPAPAIETTLAGLVPDPATRAAAVTLYQAVAEEISAEETSTARAGADEAVVTRLIATEHGWAEPARRLAAAHASSGGRTYLYEFAWGWPAQNDGVGAAHLADLPYFFANLHQPGVPGFLGEKGQGPAAAEVARQASSAVAQFITHGDLTSGLLPPWPPFTPDGRHTMVIDRHPAAVAGHIAERLDFWETHRAGTAAPLDSIGTPADQGQD